MARLTADTTTYAGCLSILRAGEVLLVLPVVDRLGADLSVLSGIVIQTGSCCMLDSGRLPKYC
jgi:hypothetical protein